MNVNEAKRIVSSYVTGTSVGRQDLEDACETLNRGELEYISYLREEFAIPEAAPDLCDIFADRAAEFSTMNEATRLREMPELCGHLKVCNDCLGLYRELYLGAFAAGIQKVGGQLRRLAEPIGLLLSWAGNITEFGVGPEALAFEDSTLAKAMDLEPKEGLSKEKAWELVLDEARNLRLHLDIVAGRRPRTFDIRFNLTGPDGATESSMDLAWQKADGTGKGNGRLSYYQMNPLELDCDSWLLRLTSAEGNSWEIPLDLKHQD